MKMADGGFRPAYNVQVISATGTPIVVDVQPATTGSDRGLLRPGLERLRRRFGRLPERYLADGGFTAADAIEWAHSQNIEVYCAPSNSKHGTDPYAPRPADGRSEEQTSELQSLMRISYAVFCLKKKKIQKRITQTTV